MYAERKTNVKRVPSSPYGLRRGRQENYFIFFFSKGLYPKARGADVNQITTTTFDVSGNCVSIVTDVSLTGGQFLFAPLQLVL